MKMITHKHNKTKPYQNHNITKDNITKRKHDET